MYVWIRSSLYILSLMSFCLTYPFQKPESSLDTTLNLSNSKFEVALKNFTHIIHQNSILPTNSCLIRPYNTISMTDISTKNIHMKITLLYTLLRAHGIFFINSFEPEKMMNEDTSLIYRCNASTLIYAILKLGLDVQTLKEKDKEEFTQLINSINQTTIEYSKELWQQCLNIMKLKKIINSVKFEIKASKFPALKENQYKEKSDLLVAQELIKKIAEYPVVSHLFDDIVIPNCTDNASKVLTAEWNKFFISVNQFCTKKISGFLSNSSCEVIWRSFVEYIVQQIENYVKECITYPIICAQEIIKKPNPCLFKAYYQSSCWFLQNPSITQQHKAILYTIATLLDLSKIQPFGLEATTV